MPIQYRTFYVKKLMHMKEKEKEQYNSQGKSDNSPKKFARGPAINKS